MVANTLLLALWSLLSAHFFITLILFWISNLMSRIERKNFEEKKLEFQCMLENAWTIQFKWNGIELK